MKLWRECTSLCGRKLSLSRLRKLLLLSRRLLGYYSSSLSLFSVRIFRITFNRECMVVEMLGWEFRGED
jgi:hypothetical protein